jgi:hypothetical protein
MRCLTVSCKKTIDEVVKLRIAAKPPNSHEFGYSNADLFHSIQPGSNREEDEQLLEFLRGVGPIH